VRPGRRGPVWEERRATSTATWQIERRVLEALALDEFRQGHLGRAELRRLLGFATRAKLDEFLIGHGVFGTYTADDLERDRHDLQRLGF
jgi:hypothetical protein